MKINLKFAVSLLVTSAAAVAIAEVLDRPTGIKIGTRMTVRPTVGISATYDSNVGSRHDGGDEDVMWTVNPNLGVNYCAENWALDLNVHYNYRAYSKSHDGDYNQHSYGETLRWNWRNEQEEGELSGWSAMISESFEQISMLDDLSLANGQGYTADHRQLNVNGALQRRFTEKFHSDLNAGYYWLDYQNDIDPRTASGSKSLYGWQRWQAGLTCGYAPSPWTDFLGNIGYQGYRQDNVEGSNLDQNSQGYTAQIGIGSFMTERISYRALAGWSRFEYANNASASDGFVYSLSGSWKIGETWNMMLLASSYYQPSEREYSAKSRVDSVSWGLAKSMIRGKLRGTFDLSYQHTTHETVASTTASSTDYAVDVVTGRLGANYTLNRFLSTFAYGEYQRSFNDESDTSSGYCDYDRWRVTCGVRLTY